MDKNFLKYQISAFKDLIGLFNYEFESEGKNFKLIDLVKNHYLLKKDNPPYLSDLLNEKGTNNESWFKENITAEYSDILFNATNFDEVAKNFVSLYNAYVISSNEDTLVRFDYDSMAFSSSNDTFDTQNIAFTYNPDLSNLIGDKELDYDHSYLRKLREIGYAFSNDLTFLSELSEKGKNISFLIEQFKTILLDQQGVKALLPLESDFNFRPQDIGKQIELNIGTEFNDNYEYKEVLDSAVLADNNVLFSNLVKISELARQKRTSENGIKYIDQVNRKALLQNNYKFYALASLKDNNGLFARTGVNLIFNKERTVSAVVDGFDFYYSLMLMTKADSENIFDIYYDEIRELVVLIGKRSASAKIPIGFNQSTLQIEYDIKDVFLTVTLPVIKTDFPTVINENWLFSYSLSTSLKDVLEFSKEAEEISKIKIPTEFLNQKDIVSKEQMFRIETIEDKINKLKLSGKDLVDKIIEYAEEYIQTYAKRTIIEEIKDENGKVTKVLYGNYEPKTDGKRFMITDNIPNYDYVWKVNELFWRYNKDISPRELFAYFIAKGDEYNYRLLSYRILGIDSYLFKERVVEQLLKEGLLCVDDFRINVQNKIIEKPLVLSYKYEYATGNYYEKRRNLRSKPQEDLDDMSIYPMRESIMLYYGEDLGENIIQNQISLLESEEIKPKELTWGSKSDNTKLYSHPLDPIFISNQEIKEKGGWNKNVLKSFYDFLGSTSFTNTEITRDDLLYGYILRLPESVSLPLNFLKEFNCYKIGVLSKEDSLNTKGTDVFAVFGSNDIKNEKPLFIGDDVTVGDASCKKYIQGKPQGGMVEVRRKVDSTGSDRGTYAFSKRMKYITDESYANLYGGGFISKEEADGKKISDVNKKNIIAEILIAYNLKQPKVIMEGDIQFNKFMNIKVDDLDALKMQQIWNETYNYQMYPKTHTKIDGYDDFVLKLDNSKFPIFIEHSRYFGFNTSEEFSLNYNQVDGIKYHVGNNNSSLLAHDVGFGKTSTSICAISHLFLTGQAKRPLISVPNPVYVNFIREIKGETSTSGLSLRGLIPHINIVELKNARKDVFIKYDKKTHTQTGGIKKYTKSQITNIDKFRDVTKSIVTQINKKVKNIYFTPFGSTKDNFDDLIRFIEKSFDKELIDWRIEGFFTKYIDSLSNVKGDYSSTWREKLNGFNDEESDKLKRIADDKKTNDKQKKEKSSKVVETYTKKKSKEYDKLVREFTNEIVYIIRSNEQAIYDRIGTYEECFLKKYSIVVCTHEAIGQLRINDDVAKEVSLELKDDSTYSRALLKNPVMFDKLDIDSVIVDEIHNFNELFSYSKRQIASIRPEYRSISAYISNDYSFSYFSGIEKPRFTKKSKGSNMDTVIKFNLKGSYTSTKKATLFGICRTLQNNFKKTGGYNVMLLSATPFVDDLFQMIGVFNMIRPFQMPLSFFENYLYQEWDWENDHKGETVLKVQTSNFKNHEARNNWIKLFSQFYTFDARINANRPNKFTYPYDCKVPNIAQYQDNCDTNVYLDFSKEQYEIFKNVGKFMEGAIGFSGIVPSTKNTIKIKKEVVVDADVLSYVKELIDETSDSYSVESASQIFIQENWMNVIDDTKNPHHQEVLDVYEIIKDEIEEQLGLAEDDSDDDSVGEEGATRVDDINDASEIKGNGVGSKDSGTRALRGQDLGKKLALSPYLVTPDGAMEGNINPNLPPLFGTNNPEDKLKSAINFVETSPKIYFAVKAIESTINHHIENKEDITGQILFMMYGQKFIYGGVIYNSMDLIKCYIENSFNLKQTFTVEESDDLSSSDVHTSKCGVKTNIEGGKHKDVKYKTYKLSEVQIISGSIQDPLYKSAIAKAFNSGKIKILIGSSTIKEGINLQGIKGQQGEHGNSTIYVLTADYAPMVMMQLEGRVWRQGNPLENVRMVYPLIKNSIDSHIYSKLNEKIKKVKTMLEAGIYDFKETQFEKDIDGISLALNTNIDEKIKIMWSKEERRIVREAKSIDSVKTRVDNVKKKYSDANEALSDLVIVYNAVGNALQDYYLGGFIRSEYSKVRQELNTTYSSKRAEITEQLSKKYDKDILAYETAKEENEKLNKENKKKKLPEVEFTLQRPLKKDAEYQPDFTQLYAEQDKAEKDAKASIVNQIRQKAKDGIFTEDEITYFNPISTSKSFSEIGIALNKLIGELSVGFIKIIRDEMVILNSQIDVSGYYWALESKFAYIDYAFTKAIIDNEGMEKRMVEHIKKNNVQNESGGFSLFKDFAKLFINGGVYENILSDYQSLVFSKGETISTIDTVIDEYSEKITELNTKLSGKNDFVVKYRRYFIDEEEKIKKEREKLTNMKEYVLLEVNKFAKTNKFIYFRGKYTETEKATMFTIKK